MDLIKKYAVKVWSSDRMLKKTFLTLPLIHELLQKANDVGIQGSKVVLENDGSEICDDEILAHYIDEKSVFMILDYQQLWTQSINISTSYFQETLPTEKPIIQSPEINEFFITPHNTHESQVIEKEQREITNSSSNSQDNDDADNLSISSTALSNTSSANSTCVMLFSSFIIPWNKFPSDITTMFENKTYLGKRMNCLGNILIDELRQISFYIPMSIIRTIAHKVASKYPDSFYLKDNDQVIITTIPVALITIMKNRNSFLNRPPKRIPEDLIINIPAKHLKTANVLKTTCINWQPPKIGSGETYDGIESKQKFLQDIFKRNKITVEERETVKQFMKDCFAVQRIFLNDRNCIPDAKQIQEKYPFLFEMEFAFQHFEQLMAINPVKIKNEFERKQEILKRFWKESKQKNICDCIKGNNINNTYNLINCFFVYFNEDSSFMFKTFEFGTTFDEVNSACPTNTPWFALINTLTNDKCHSYVFFEKVIVLKLDNSNVLDLFTLCLTYFYNFNILYPKEISQTLEFFSRFFLKHYINNIRGKKNHINNISKINNLINKLNIYITKQTD